jgi:hypothetical protein
MFLMHACYHDFATGGAVQVALANILAQLLHSRLSCTKMLFMHNHQLTS